MGERVKGWHFSIGKMRKGIHEPSGRFWTEDDPEELKDLPHLWFVTQSPWKGGSIYRANEAYPVSTKLYVHEIETDADFVIYDSTATDWAATTGEFKVKKVSEWKKS